MRHIVVIAALEREVQGLLAQWRKTYSILPGTSLRCYKHEGMSVVCAGIGPDAAAIAAEAVVAAERPDLLVSAGFAGAVDPELRVGSLVTPALVVSTATGRSYSTISGAGVLVSTDRIADAAMKSDFYARHNAKAVDMEAAAVGEVARRNGIGFMAIKAISDDSRTTLPDMSRFVDRAGKFNAGTFLVHVILRPPLWGAVWRLAHNTSMASKALHQYLSGNLQSGEFQRLASENVSINPKSRSENRR